MFLRRTDYLKQIRNDNLEVVVQGDDAIRKDAELAAQAELESYLRHRYDTAKIFLNIQAYDTGVTYTTGDLVTFPDVEDDFYSVLPDPTTGEDITVIGINPPDDAVKWQAGDTRNPLIKMHLVDVTLYHLHSSINPRNIPDFRVARRDDCVSWLKMVAKGQITVNLPRLEPEEDQLGLRIKHGSNEKFNHNY